MNWLHDEFLLEQTRKDKLVNAEKERLFSLWKKGQKRDDGQRPFTRTTQFFHNLSQLSRIRIHVSFEMRDPCTEGTAVQ